MRYTLRLLTIQQFERACTSCAPASVCVGRPGTMGTRRFTIGLWVGQSATPNSHDERQGSRSKELRKGEPVYEAPYQVLYCPWCGHDIAPTDYVADDDSERERLVTCPRDRECDFTPIDAASSSFPVLLVDEEIYRKSPSMLLATVDKFAQMPWNGEVAVPLRPCRTRCPRRGFLAPDSEHPATHRRRRRRTPRRRLIGRDRTPRSARPDHPGRAAPDRGAPRDARRALRDRGRALCSRRVTASASDQRSSRQPRPSVAPFEQVEALFDRELRCSRRSVLEPEDSFFAVRRRRRTMRRDACTLASWRRGRHEDRACTRLARPCSADAGLRETPVAGCRPYMTLIGYFN